MLEGRTNEWPEGVFAKFSAQINFLHQLSGAGEFHFQSYRRAKVLVIGCGPFLVSLAAALFESGLTRFYVLITDTTPTDRRRLDDLVKHALPADPGSAIDEIPLPKKGRNFWREVVRPFHSIVYVSHGVDIAELRNLQKACREGRKPLLPAVLALQAGMIGPWVSPNTQGTGEQPGSQGFMMQPNPQELRLRPVLQGCWESAWRRIHRTALGQVAPIGFSSTAGALLANVVAFELLKTITNVARSELETKFYLLDLETWVGAGYSYAPHPLATGRMAAKRVLDAVWQLDRSPQSVGQDDTQGNGMQRRSTQSNLLAYFSCLTSEQTGIFHKWGEEELRQLPLSQCRVQAVDPLSKGPADLLPGVVCIALTHGEARREAGLTGVEAYISRLARRLVSGLDDLQESEYIGAGAGETFAEGICRGLQKCLTAELGKRLTHRIPTVRQMKFEAVEDDRCRFYIRALTAMPGTPVVGLDEHISGFPVVWVGTGGKWYGCPGLNICMAARQALEYALLHAQNEENCFVTKQDSLQISSTVRLVQVQPSPGIPAGGKKGHTELARNAMRILEQYHRRLLLFSLEVEPFLKGEPVEAFGVLLREGLTQ